MTTFTPELEKLNMSCQIYIEDEEAWKVFLRTHDEHTVWHAIVDMRRLYCSLKEKKIPCRHVDDRFDIGIRFYKRRFKQDWLPF